MTSDYALPTSRPRPFVTVAYVASSGSALVPAVMPPSCVHASTGDPACVLVVHHTRERKAGPQIPVSRNRRRRRYEFCVVHGRRRAAQIARIEAQTHGRSKTCAYTPAALA